MDSGGDVFDRLVLDTSPGPRRSSFPPHTIVALREILAIGVYRYRGQA